MIDVAEDDLSNCSGEFRFTSSGRANSIYKGKMIKNNFENSTANVLKQ